MTLWPEMVTPVAAMGTPILQGRSFGRADLSGEQVCVLSASAAGYFFPDEDAVGRFVYAGGLPIKITTARRKPMRLKRTE
jgi:hypothetical protein